jgi:hypothetical protein
MKWLKAINCHNRKASLAKMAGGSVKTAETAGAGKTEKNMAAAKWRLRKKTAWHLFARGGKNSVSESVSGRRQPTAAAAWRRRSGMKISATAASAAAAIERRPAERNCR